MTDGQHSIMLLANGLPNLITSFHWPIKMLSLLGPYSVSHFQFKAITVTSENDKTTALASLGYTRAFQQLLSHPEDGVCRVSLSTIDAPAACSFTK